MSRLTKPRVDKLVRGAKQVGGSTAMLARVPIVLAVKQGAPSPDISSVEAFKRTATSGIHLAQALVEDDEDVRNFTRTALISLGYRVYEASDAVSGLEMLAEHRRVLFHRPPIQKHQHAVEPAQLLLLQSYHDEDIF